MIELYSIRDVARILAVQESRLRYWMQVGFVGATVRKGGRFYYTFRDLVGVKAAKDLLAADIPLQKARKAVEGLKKALPDDTHPTSRLRVCSDGETIVALADDRAFEPIGGQVVMAFNLPSFGEQGLDNFELVTWLSLHAPAGLPAELQKKINADVNAALRMPEVRERINALNLDVIGGTPEQLTAHLASERRKFSAVIKAAGIKAE